ncbi:uncharacterized protein LOC118647615 [Monomorium pharaonis]|uniref:uncharacterized protein LOC118647615 n=1 Tax=Monomorium pharaonis TaxID=307658 RepID=UPI001746162B|nr:uncharacterized protein LOC118647615 [Monomorium pharaonis]
MKSNIFYLILVVAGNCQLANFNCQIADNVKNVGSKKSKVPSKKKASKKLSLEEEEHLILTVQQRKPLWNISQPVDQRSRETWKRLWQEVANELNGVLDVAAVQQKFKSLRDTYCKIVQSEQYLPSGSGRNENEDRHKWKHYDIMEFLRDTSLSKDTSSNIPNTENELNNSAESTFGIQSLIDIDPDDSNSTKTPVSLPSTSTSTKRRRLNTNSSSASDILAASTNPLDKLIQIFERRENALNVPPNTNDLLDEVDHVTNSSNTVAQNSA